MVVLLQWNWNNVRLDVQQASSQDGTQVESVHTTVDYSQQPHRNLFTWLERPRHAGTAGGDYTVDDVGGGKRRHELRHGIVLEERTSERHKDDPRVCRERRQGQGHTDSTGCQEGQRKWRNIIQRTRYVTSLVWKYGICRLNVARDTRVATIALA